MPKPSPTVLDNALELVHACFYRFPQLGSEAAAVPYRSVP
jgi:hypothetical protein